MRTSVFVVPLLLVLASWPGTRPAAAQAPPGTGAATEEPPVGKREFHVIPLKHTSAAEVAAVLQDLFGGGRPGSGGRNPFFMRGEVRIGVDQRTNSIVFVGDLSELEGVRKLIVALDSDRAASDTRRQIRLVPLRTSAVDEGLDQALKVVFLGKGGSYAMDSQRRMVVLSGDLDTLESAAKVLAEMDKAVEEKPAGGELQVRVVWLVSGTALEDAAKVPPDLGDVVAELGRLGIDKPVLAAQSIINATPNAEFQMDGSAKLDFQCQLSVSGVLFDQKPNPALKVNIKASRLGPQPERICDLKTSITTPLGHAVVLGVTPTYGMTSVFVVQVLERDANRPRKK